MGNKIQVVKGTIFCDIDGTLVKTVTEEPIIENIEQINKAYDYYGGGREEEPTTCLLIDEVCSQKVCPRLNKKKVVRHNKRVEMDIFKPCIKLGDENL